jgi:hypothetical protein
MDAERLPVPAKPFWAEKVRVVDPDCPGLAMLIVVGLIATLYVPPTSIRATGDVEPL